MYQRNTINKDNRRQFVIQNHYFTYQRKSNHKLQVQAFNIIVTDLQNQINNLTGGDPGSGDPDGTGTIHFSFLRFTYLMYTNMLELIFVCIT